jgi:4-alpha-glucanotransferase
MTKRSSGILMHISSLPGPFGIGDLGPWAYRFADFLARTSQAYWQILPLGPTTPVHGNSPYSSTSTFAGNPLLISPDLLVRDGYLEESDIEPGPEGAEDRVDYPSVVDFKARILSSAYQRFLGRQDRSEFDGFCEANGHWLEDFVLFSALKARAGGQVWSDWPRDLRDRRPDALDAARQELAENMQRERLVQFLFFKQWFELKSYCNQRGIEILGDIPIYVTYDGADVWSNPQIFKLDGSKRPLYVSGVPPDYFSATGQLWGNPVYDWQVCKDSGFAWWMRRMEHALSMCDLVRIDHFRGLVAYWEVPASHGTATKGEWVKVPTHEFISSLKERFPELPIIAEDLGLITDDVKGVMEQYGFPGMKVLLFAFGEDKPDHPYLPHNYDRNCVAYTGTHDNTTAKGWFENIATPDDKHRLFRYLGRQVAAERIAWELSRLAIASVADTAIIPTQDLLGLGEHARMNLPGTLEGHWEWRLKPDQLTSQIEEVLADATRTYGRS